MKVKINNLRIRESQPLLKPMELAEALPVSQQAAANVQRARLTIEAILSGRDPRLLAIVGPCSVHDPDALLEFARRYQADTRALTDHIYPVLRVYFEKPRSVAGWKGLINDPGLDNSFRINDGLQIARKLLLDLAEMDLPAASEFLDTTFGQYYAELVSFGAIGARTVESQIHRELASGLSMPVGFKNATSGAINVAIDAIRAARNPHWFPSLTNHGAPAILHSTGNEHCYLILRGGSDTGPNYDADYVEAAACTLARANLQPSVIVDCSHGNSEKDPARQAIVMTSVIEQLAAGNSAIRGIMLESHLVAGSQPVVNGKAATYGQSITDACLALDDTLPLLKELADALA
ncbi:MAG: 3-deoxy-7-phosphoheptulonate synthase [Pseudomonadota bacterium]